jgi:hypothetical protein
MISGCRTICSPWNPNSSTSVASSAISEIGCKVRRVCVKATSPPCASNERRHSWAAITGTTMYSTTERKRVVHGTVIEDRPSSSATIGAKANTIMVSLSATCVRVKFGSPSVRFDQTNTIAVQGAAASRISPAT